MAMTLISTSTASSSSVVDITSGIDSTYKLYIFKFINIHPATNGATFKFQVNVASASGFNEQITSTFFSATHTEADATTFAYGAGSDQANGTSYQVLCNDVANDADANTSGTLWLFNPSNTTYVKHFMSTFSNMSNGPKSEHAFMSGYANVTGAIDEISFAFSAGNIDAGTIKMYGVA